MVLTQWETLCDLFFCFFWKNCCPYLDIRGDWLATRKMAGRGWLQIYPSRWKERGEIVSLLVYMWFVIVLPAQELELHKLLFGNCNDDILLNLLGTFYIDQEKGWTLLNRGTVIGSVHFNIAELMVHDVHEKQNVPPPYEIGRNYTPFRWNCGLADGSMKSKLAFVHQPDSSARKTAFSLRCFAAILLQKNTI